MGGLLGGISTIADTFNMISLSTVSLVHLLAIVIVIGCVVDLHQKEKDKYFTGGLVLFIFACATRGCFSFHGIPVVVVFSAIIGYFIAGCWDRIFKYICKTPKRVTLCIASIFLVGTTYISGIDNLFYVSDNTYIDTSKTVYALSELTDNYERVGFFLADHTSLLEAQVLPCNPTWGVCPWFWEWERDATIESLIDNKPRVFVYNDSIEVWGYRIRDFAPEIGRLLARNYKSLSDAGYPEIYVSNEYYYESLDRINTDRVFTTYHSSGSVGEITANDIVEQHFHSYRDSRINMISLIVGTYSRQNTCHLIVSIRNDETYETTELFNCSCEELRDNSINYFDFDSFQLEADMDYSIIIESPDADSGNAITVYLAEQFVNESFRSSFRGVQGANLIAMNIFRESEPQQALHIEYG